MKSRDIQRGISSRHVRAGGETPDIGRVSRLHDPDVRPKSGVSRSRGSRQNAGRKKAVMIWSIGLGTATLSVMGAAFFMWLLPLMKPGGGHLANDAARTDREVRVASRFPSPSREEALDLVNRALSNGDPDQVDRLFRVGSSTSRAVADFCEASGERDGKLNGMDWLSCLDTGGLLIEGVVVNYQGKEKPVQRLALLTPDGSGRWQLDFDAFARSVKPSWEDILDGGADQAVVRVIVAPDVYYNGPFRDEGEWTSYGMTSPDLDQILRGYCKVGSPQADVMKRLFSDETRTSRAILEIRRVKDGEKGQFEITRLLARDWILPESPGKED